MKLIRSLSQIISRTIAINECPLCHESTDNNAFCSACFADLQHWKITHQVCPLCAKPSINAQVCGHCQKNPVFIDGLWASFAYQAPISTLLHYLKYRHALVYSGCLKELLLHHPPPWISQFPFHQVVAMPLSRNRLLERGFNQSDELAQAVSKKYHIPLLPITTIGRKHHPPQSKLSRKERLKNVRGVFSITSSLKNQNILLIDDVVTTGATLNELAKTLKKSGVKQVFAWTLLRR